MTTKKTAAKPAAGHEVSTAKAEPKAKAPAKAKAAKK